MKLITILASILFANFAHATGSVYCSSASGETNISFAISHIQGSPMLSDISFNSATIPRERIINYKNIDSEQYVLVLDEDFNEKALEVKYNFLTETGTMLSVNNSKEPVVTAIECTLE